MAFCGVEVCSPMSSQYGGIEEEGSLILDGAAVTVGATEPVPSVIVVDGTDGADVAIVSAIEAGDAVEHWMLPKQIMSLGHPAPLGHGVALSQRDIASS